MSTKTADPEPAPGRAMPDEFSPRHLRARVLQLGLLVVVVVAIIWATPGLSSLRDELKDASGGWFVLAIAFEIASTLSYVVIFRTVFCRRMSWRLSYQIGMAEQAANSMLPASGAGGLALGVWALRRGGMSTEQIARRTVAFFFLTSLANVAGVLVFAALYAVGVLQDDRNPALTYGFGGAAAVASAFVIALPWLLMGKAPIAIASGSSGRIAAAARFLRYSLTQGIRDGVSLLRQRPVGVIAGSVGTMAFDFAVLAVCFRAFGSSPALGVLVLGYLIGQLGGNLPLPGGIGGLDGGLIATFALYHTPLAATTAAVLIYHAVSLWIPALLGSVAFVQLRDTLQREIDPTAICGPLAEPI